MSTTKKFQSGSVILISLAHFVHDVYSSFLVPLLPIIIERLTLTFSQAGFLTVIQRLPSLLNPLIGILIDRSSLKLFVIFAPAVTVIMMSLIGIADSYILLVTILLITGLSAAMFHVPAPVMIKKVAGDRVGKGMSFFMLGGELARSVGPIIILGSVSVWGFEGSFKLIPFGLTASLILFLRFRKFEVGYIPNKNKNNEILSTLKQHSKMLLLIVGILFFVSVVKSTITTFVTVYLTNQGESLWFSGSALSLFQFAGAAGTFFSGTISDKIGRKKVLLISSALNPFLLLGFILSNNLFSMLFLVFLGFFIFAFTPVLLTVVNESDSKLPTFLNGMFMTINFLTSAVAVLSISFIADVFTLHHMYYFSSALGLLVVPFVLKLDH